MKSHDGLDKEEEGSAAKKLKLHENVSFPCQVIVESILICSFVNSVFHW